MFLVTSRLIIDSGSFSVLYFFSFLLLIPLCGGDVIGPSHPLSALTGEDIILPCHLQPAVDVSRETVEWSRSDLEPRLVYVWRGSVDVETIEHASYKGRASLFLDEMKHGNISLRLSRVRLSDGGTYRCFVPEMGSSSTVQLVVGAASSPVIQMSNNSNSGEGDEGRLVLRCESRGWYPEPEVLWLDAEGNLLSAGPPETVRGPDDLYTVSSRVTVDKRHSNSFTCRVQQNNISQTREAHINVPDSSTPGSSSSSATIIGLIVPFVVIIVVIVSVFVWKWRQRRLKNKKHPNDEEMLSEKKKKKNDPSTEPLMERGRDGETAEDEDMERHPGLHPQTQDETHQIQTNQGERKEREGITERNCLDNRKEETETDLGRENTDNKMEEEPEMENNQQTEEGEKTTQRRGDEMESQRLMDEGKHGEEPLNDEDKEKRKKKTKTQKKKKKKKETQTEEAEVQNVEYERKPGEELMEKEKEKLKTKLQAKEKYEKTFEERLSRLKSQIEDKEKQINELLQQLKEVEREMESEKPLETKKDLEEKKSELQKDLEKKKRDMDRMKKDETVLIERIKKERNEKEEIIRKLEEMEKQRNEGGNQSESDEDL